VTTNDLGRWHHANQTETVSGVWEVARPLRDTSRWRQLRREWRCRTTVGHCWHPIGMIDWWCCVCSGETDGMPAQNCAHCRTKGDDGGR
jgi:hypothetical protein